MAYAKSGNQRQAYLDAGYKCKPAAADANASRLLNNDKVKKRLSEIYEKIESEKIADVKEMQEVLTKIIRKEADEEVLISPNISEDGELHRIRKEPALKDIINAINTLGKMQGAFTSKIDLDGAVPVVISGGDDLAD